MAARQANVSCSTFGDLVMQLAASRKVTSFPPPLSASAYRRDVAAHLFPKTGDLVLTASQRKKL